MRVNNTEFFPTEDFEGRMVGLMTTSYNPDTKTRLAIAFRTLRNYGQANIPAVMVDGSPDEETREQLRERGAIVLHAPGLGLASSAILGAEFIRENGGEQIIKQEPEKDRIPKFASKIGRALRYNDIVIIGRTRRAMRSLPTTQRQTETIGGRLMTEHLGLPPDALSGARAYARTGVDALLAYDIEKWGDNWLHLHVPPLEVIRQGGSVGGVRIPLMHPEEMVKEEEDSPTFDNKRAAQLHLHTEFIQEYLKDNPGYQLLSF